MRSDHRGSQEKNCFPQDTVLTDTGHLRHVQVIPIKAIAGVTFLHPHTAAVFTAIEDAALLSLKLLKAV